MIRGDVRLTACIEDGVWAGFPGLLNCRGRGKQGRGGDERGKWARKRPANDHSVMLTETEILKNWNTEIIFVISRLLGHVAGRASKKTKGGEVA